MKTTALTLAVFAGIATASPANNTNIESLSIQDPADSPTTMTIDISGVNSWDEQGSSLNEIITTSFPSQFQIIGISWDLTINAFGSFFFKDANIRLFNTDESGSFTLTLRDGVDDGTGMRIFAGSLDLVAWGEDFTTNADNLLNIEFFESVVDNPGGIDAIYGPGSFLTIHVKKVPTPGSLAVLGLGGLVATRRRRTVHAFQS